MRSSKAWLIALLVGVMCLFFFIVFVGGGDTPVGEDGNQVATRPIEQLGSVVVFTQDIPARTPITPEMIEVQQVPAEYIHPMALLSVEDAVDMITLVSINAGEQLLNTKIADPNTNYLSYRLKEGHVAFPVAVSELTSAGGMIRVGDVVHVLGNFTEDVAGEDMTDFFLYDINVIAIGQDMAINAKSEGADAMSTMTLEVTPEQAQQLTWAQNHGSIAFILKSALDKYATEDLEKVTAENFFGDVEAFDDLEYLKVLQKIASIRQAEEALNEFGKGDVQHIREQLGYDKFYYDELIKDGEKPTVEDGKSIKEDK